MGLNDFPPNVQQKIQNLTPEELKAFENDYADAKFKKAIDEKPELIDSWKVLQKAEVESALRTDPTILERLSSYIKKEYKGLNGEDLTKRGNDVAVGVDLDLADGGLNKLSEALKEAQRQGGTEGVQRFLNGTAINAAGRNTPDVSKIKELEDVGTGLFDKNTGLEIKFGEIGLGYSGVMSPDGRVAFTLTFDNRPLLKRISGFNTSKLIRHVRERMGVEKMGTRNGAHNTLKTKTFNKEPYLWGFALNNKNGLEISFSSGQVHNLGKLGRFVPLKKTTENVPRNATILNRPHQKKVIEYLESYFGQKIKLKAPELRENSIGEKVMFHYY